MKTKLAPSASLHAESSAGHAHESPLAPLLERAPSAALQTQSSAPASPPINGLLLGVLCEIDPGGTPWVQIAQLGTAPTAARAATQLTADDIGRQVALGFENGAIECPIILGLMHHSVQAAQITSPQPLHIEQDGERTLIEASQELELRCGEAVILLQADGRIQLRGEYITSHASAGQRIRGGSVQIN